MGIRKGTLSAFDPATYRASVRLDGSLKAGLEGIAVARNIGAAGLTAGRKGAVVFFDENDAREAVVVAVYE